MFTAFGYSIYWCFHFKNILGAFKTRSLHLKFDKDLHSRSVNNQTTVSGSFVDKYPISSRKWEPSPSIVNIDVHRCQNWRKLEVTSAPTHPAAGPGGQHQRGIRDNFPRLGRSLFSDTAGAGCHLPWSRPGRVWYY